MFVTSLLISMCLSSPQLERPELTLTQGYVESNMNRNARGKKGEKGAWQVREKYWGKVPKHLLGQAQQSERILNELLAESNNNLHTALRKYNGRGAKAVKYANQVRKKTIERCILTV